MPRFDVCICTNRDKTSSSFRLMIHLTIKAHPSKAKWRTSFRLALHPQGYAAPFALFGIRWGGSHLLCRETGTRFFRALIFIS